MYIIKRCVRKTIRAQEMVAVIINNTMEGVEENEEEEDFGTCLSMSPFLGQRLACCSQPSSPGPSLSRHLLWVLASPGRARKGPGGGQEGG